MLKSLVLVLAATAGVGFVVAALPDAGACGKCCEFTAAAGGDDHAKQHADKCAKQCGDCMRECEGCSTYCANQAAGGKKEFLKAMALCQDCADVCCSSTKILARFGPMSLASCESCAKSCDTCADGCEKMGAGDKNLARCAKACRDCAKECRTMIKHVGH